MNSRTTFIILAPALASFVLVNAFHSIPQVQGRTPVNPVTNSTLSTSETGPSDDQTPPWVNEASLQETNFSDEPEDAPESSPPENSFGAQNWQSRPIDEVQDSTFAPTPTLKDSNAGPSLGSNSTEENDDQVHYGMMTTKDGRYMNTHISHNGPPSSSEILPTPTSSCPGPCNSHTGEGILDINGRCTIICYNNLVLNQARDDCVCPPTFQLDESQVKCVCRSPFVQCGSKCVLKPSQQAATQQKSKKKRSFVPQLPLGASMLHGKYPRTDIDRQNCPDNELACPMKSGGYECLDPDVTLESCGGCTSLDQGVDCRNITGAGEVGCNSGVCVIITCGHGYQLVGGTCVLKNYKKH